MAQNATYTRRINLFINGKEVKNDVKSIKAEMQKLINAQAKMTIGSKEYIAAGRQIQQLNAILRRHRNELNQTNQSWLSLSNMADRFNKYAGVFAGFAASFAGVVLGAKKAVTMYLELDEKMADVMKTTGLTKEQVKQLSTELGKIDTRTSQQNLLDLARVAGKLGMTSQQEIIGFVKASDQIAVSLSEDLGGNVEESVNQLGKLTDIFKLKDEFGIEQALLKVGSTINSLGAAGTANEGFLVEFAKRVGGIAPMAGVSITQVMGLGATLDELGQTAEVSGTTYAQVIGAMFKDTPKFAKMAKMGVEEFTALLGKDANEAFIKVLEGAKGTSGGFAEMAQNLDAMGLDGARSTAVLGVLANNIDKLRDRQAYANEEFEKGTSLTNEFNTKNETATAKLEKAQKEVAALAVQLGEKLNPYMTYVNVSFGKFLRLLMGAPAWLNENWVLLTAIGGALLAYNGRQIALTASKLKDKAVSLAVAAQEKAGLIWMGLKSAAIQLQISLTGKATIAQLRYIAVAKAAGAIMNPWQLLVIAISAAIVAYKAFGAAQSRLNKGFAEFTSKVEAEKKSMNDLFEVVKKSKEGTRERAAAIQLLNDKYGQYLPKLLTEKSSLQEIERAQKAANGALVRSIAIKSQQADIEEAVNASLEAKKKIYERIIEVATRSGGENMGAIASASINEYAQKIMEAKTEEGKHTEKSIALIREFAKKFNIDYQVEAFRLNDIVDAEMELKTSMKGINTFYETIISGLGDVKVAQEEVTRTAPDIIPEGSTPAATGNGSSGSEKTKTQAEIAAEEEEKQIEELAKKRKDAEQTIANAVIDIRKRLKLATMSQEEQEKQQIIDNYADLLQTAETYGLNRVELEELQQGELDALQKHHDEQRLAKKREVEEQIAELTATEREKEVKQVTDFYTKLIAAAEESGIATTELYNLMGQELERIKGETFSDEADIFGFTEDDWSALLGKFDLVMQALDQIGSIWGNLNQITANKEQSAFNKYEKNTKKKKELLSSQLESGAISQEQYNAKVTKLDEDLDKKKAEMQRKQAERDKKLKIFQAVTSTASAIIHMLADPGGVPGIALSALAAIEGATQIAAITSEPLPEYAIGGYTNGARAYIAGEKGKEWIASNDMLNNPYTGPVIAALESVRNGSAPSGVFGKINTPAFGAMTASVPQFADGGYTTRSTSTMGNAAMQGMDIAPLIAGFNAIVDEIRPLRQYMSDPENRRASIDERTLRRHNDEALQRKTFGRIG